MLLAFPPGLLGSRPLHRHPQHLGHGLKEVNLIVRITTPPRRVCAQDAQGRVLARDRNADAAHHPVIIDQQ